MVLAGMIGLIIAFAATVVGVLALAIGALRKGTPVRVLARVGRISAFVVAGALTLCVGILAVCFLTEDYTIMYVLDNHSSATGSSAWLYKLSGVWAGREGSLLLWAWIISLFGAAMSAHKLSSLERLDNVAVLVMQVVLAAFTGVLLFSADNMPFVATPASYFSSDGTLSAAGQLLGMNALLEHWAMAVHPPALFIGYAGCTVPFAYAVAALVANDASVTWVNRSTRYALISWLFLTVGIGLGAVWAYVCLGWGGYWGWDPVENASLLSWLVCTALVHSFTVYRSRGAAKGWSVACAALAFAFVIVGTFISRSGLVQSVHAFEGDAVSFALFLFLIVASIVGPAIGLIVRRKTFAAQDADDFESFASKGAMYFFNNVIMVVMAVVLAYMTLSSALPTWMPFGGESLSSSSYNALARPLGVVYLALMALCPLFGWSKTGGKQFLKEIRVPGICALVLFAVLTIYTVTTLFPVYDATMAARGSAAVTLAEAGPEVYYKGLTLLGMLVASLLFFDSLVLLVRSLKAPVKRAAGIGGAVSHVAMAVLLVGLIGSSMYVADTAGYLPYDKTTDSSSGTFVAGEYGLRYTGNTITPQDNGNVVYQVDLDVYVGVDADDQESGTFVGHISPSVTVVGRTQQQQLNAGVMSFPLEDLFVVYRGVNSATGALALEVMINPLIYLVWIGMVVLIAGMMLSAFGARQPRKKASAPTSAPCSQED